MPGSEQEGNSAHHVKWVQLVRERTKSLVSLARSEAAPDELRIIAKRVLLSRVGPWKLETLGLMRPEEVEALIQARLNRLSAQIGNEVEVVRELGIFVLLTLATTPLGVYLHEGLFIIPLLLLLRLILGNGLALIFTALFKLPGLFLLSYVLGKGYNLYWLFGEPSFSRIDLEVLLEWPGSKLYLASQEGRGGVVQALLAGGADVDLKNFHGDTALIISSEYGHEEVVQALLARGADIHIQNEEGVTALIIASWKGREGVVQALLAGGAEVNHRLETGHTALILASEQGHAAVVQALLAKGAEVNHRLESGETALKVAKTEQIKQLLGRFGIRRDSGTAP